jgi:aspartyl/asparaginyl-tRNA synthetase
MKNASPRYAKLQAYAQVCAPQLQLSLIAFETHTAYIVQPIFREEKKKKKKRKGNELI